MFSFLFSLRLIQFSSVLFIPLYSALCPSCCQDLSLLFLCSVLLTYHFGYRVSSSALLARFNFTLLCRFLSLFCSLNRYSCYCRSHQQLSLCPFLDSSQSADIQCVSSSPHRALRGVWLLPAHCGLHYPTICKCQSIKNCATLVL